jgi:hypothetical protein
MSVAAHPKIGQIVGVRFAGQVEGAVIVEHRGVFGGQHVYRVRVGERDDPDAPELELPLEDLEEVRWLVVSGPDDITEPGRDGRIFRYSLVRLDDEVQRDVDVLTTGTYLALIQHGSPEVRDAARMAGRSAVDARLGWIEPPRRIAVSTAGVRVEFAAGLLGQIEAALRRLEREGWEVHVRDDVPRGLVLDGELMLGPCWAFLARGDDHFLAMGTDDPNAAAETVLLQAQGVRS